MIASERPSEAPLSEYGSANHASPAPRSGAGRILLGFELPALVAIALAFWFPTRSSVLLLTVIAGFCCVRLATEHRPFVSTVIDWPVACFIALLPLSALGVADWSLAYGRMLSIAAGLAIVYALAAYPRTAEGAVRLTFAVGVSTALGVAAVGLVGTAWEATGKKFLVLDSLYARLPHLVQGVARGTERGAINPNETAGALVMFVPLLVALAAGLAFSGGTRARHAQALAASISLAAVATVLLLTQSRGGMFAAGAGLVVAGAWATLRLRGGRVALTSALLIALGVTGLMAWVGVSAALGGGRSYETFIGRGELWLRAIYMIQDSPWFGVGLGQFQKVVSQDYGDVALAKDFVLGVGPVALDIPQPSAPLLIDYNGNIPHAHNLLLQNALDFGIPGAGAFLAVLLASYSGLWRACMRTTDRRVVCVTSGLAGAMAAFLAFGVNDMIVIGARGGLPLWIVLGLAVALERATRVVQRRTAATAWRMSAARVVAAGLIALALLPSAAIVTNGFVTSCATLGRIPVSSPWGLVERAGEASAFLYRAGVAGVLDTRGCAPTAVSGQWSAAILHAASKSQSERVDNALLIEAGRMGSRTELAGALGAAGQDINDPRFLCALERLRGRFCRPT